MMRKTLIVAGMLALVAGPAFGQSSEFLHIDYSSLQPQASAEGSDLIYTGPGAEDRLVNYNSVMVDQPEIHFAADSKYRGLKPEDVAALAAILRDNLTAKLKEGGYVVVEQPAPNVLYVRTALTELYLKKKKRGLLSYTPVGVVAHAGMDALSETLEKVDIIEMSLEAEVADSQSLEVLGAVVLARGHKKEKGHKEERLDMDELRATVVEYSERMRCRLDNSRLPEAQRINCNDPAARQARDQAGS